MADRLQDLSPSRAFGGIEDFASPWNAFLFERLPSPTAYRRFLSELRQCEHSYNAPEIEPRNQSDLYDLFEQSGLVDAIKGIIRASKIPYDGIHKPHGHDTVRCWPDAQRPDNPFLCILGETKAKPILGGLLSIGGREHVMVYDDKNRLVLSSEASLLRPGSWIGKVLVEYTRLQAHRNSRTYDPSKPRHARADYRTKFE